MKNLLIFLLFATAFTSIAQNKNVYIAEISNEIDLGIAPYVRRVVEEAEKNSAQAIIFKINTFGGRVDAATQIKDAILNSKVKTFAFVDKRAISAGALIALSCQNIIMAPGATIGATTVVDEKGTKQSEKYQSYMRSEMRATAEKNGRPAKIAEAMVDERIVIEGLVDSTQLVTLTSSEAVKWGIADTILTSVEEIVSAYQLENKFNALEINWAEDFIRFINNPIVSSLLIMIGMVGLFVEIKTPGWGLPGTAALISLGLFFGAGYMLELASFGEIILFIIGVILLLIEIFVIPGFGITGIVGIILIIGSLFLGLLSDFHFVDWNLIYAALIQLASSLLMALILIAILIKFLPKTEMWNKLILNDNIVAQSGYTSESIFLTLVGKSGFALTDLRPSGTSLIDKKRFDVVTDGEYIVKDTEVVVTKVEGSKVVVEKRS